MICTVDRQFEIIDHTSDVGIIAYGLDQAELLANAARGMFSLMADLKEIETDSSKIIELDEQDNIALLVEWLNELIYIFDMEHFVFKEFDIDVKIGRRLKATCYGGKLDVKIHKVKCQIKAATYHNLSIVKENGIYSARIIFDI